MAAILHDIGITEVEKKYKSSAGAYQEMEGPAIARYLLSDGNLKSKTIDRICFIIRNHHSYQKINGWDFRIGVESDFLMNI